MIYACCVRVVSLLSDGACVGTQFCHCSPFNVGDRFPFPRFTRLTRNGNARVSPWASSLSDLLPWEIADSEENFSEETGKSGKSEMVEVTDDVRILISV